MSYKLFIPGPVHVSDKTLNAMTQWVMGHRSKDFVTLFESIQPKLQELFCTKDPVFISTSSAWGVMEGAIRNVTKKGVLNCMSGAFSDKWNDVAERCGIPNGALQYEWGTPINPEDVRRELSTGKYDAITFIHNETSTGSVSPIAEIRKVIDAAGHPALLMVDTISGLASIDFRFDEWGVDVCVSGSQKGLMLPPGLSFNAVSERALEYAKTTNMPRSYWDWHDMVGPNANGYFPYTPGTNLLYGLNEAIDMLHEEGLDNVFARHARHGVAARAAVRAWGLAVLCARQGEASGVLTAVLMPEGHSAAAFRATTLKHYDISLGNGLSKVADRVFRIGHLGDFNDLMLMATLSGVEMGLAKSGVPHKSGGTQAAMEHLKDTTTERVAAE